jgi:hypothetical protein
LTALISTGLATLAVVLGVPQSAVAAEAGTQARITELPRTFPADGDDQVVTAVVATETGGDCRKVRWSMDLRVRGIALDQVEFARIEDVTDFPIRVETNADTARVTDVKADPGSLCRGRTVTAGYRIAFNEGPGTAEFQIRAFDAAGKELATATGTSQISGGTGGGESADPSPAPEESDSAAPEAPAGDDPSAAPTGGAAGGPADAVGDQVAQDGEISLLGPGLIVGALLVFLGVGMLLWLRTRRRRNEPPSRYYYPMT